LEVRECLPRREVCKGPMHPDGDDSRRVVALGKHESTAMTGLLVSPKIARHF